MKRWPTSPHSHKEAVIRAHREMMAAYHQAEREKPQNETYLAGNLILDFPVSRTVRNKFLLFKPGVCNPWSAERYWSTAC